MTDPIDDLHSFDLHIYVGSRSWPDDIEYYCDVTYPGLDAAHPITINYLHTTPHYSLETAIQRASEDIAAYMRDPQEWVENYVKHHGTAWEKRRELVLEREYYERMIAEYQQTIATDQERIASIQRQLQELPERESNP